MPHQQANQQHAIDGVLQFSPGDGGLPYVQIRNAAAEATISLYGGQVLRFRPLDQDGDLLFVSERAHHQPGKAIKGGIPVCWPWFGDDPAGQGRGAHGFARTSTWAVQSTDAVTPGHTRVVLRLGDSETSQALWPHGFELTLTIDIADTLGLRLTTRNTGDTTFVVSQALHTYFAVGSIDAVTVDGLDATPYLDKVRDFAADTQAGPVTFDGEVDRIYQSVRYPLQIRDAAGRRDIVVDADDSRTAIVWNPWRDVAARMSDLADDDYRRFVCVETANAADDVIELAPGTDCSLVTTYRVTTTR